MTQPKNLTTFLPFAKKYPHDVIVEVGAMTCEEAVSFKTVFPLSNVFSFECNPRNLDICRTNVAGTDIHLIEQAVSDIDGKVSFYPPNPEKTITPYSNGNQGAASLLKASGKYPLETYVQDTIEVEATRLDTFMDKQNLPRIDILWMDIQGAELMALKGLGERIRDVGLIHLEVEFFEIYKDQPLFADIKQFLNQNGFHLLGFTTLSTYAGDAVFINKNLKAAPLTNLLAGWIKPLFNFRKKYLLRFHL